MKTTKGERALAKVIAQANRIMSEHRLNTTDVEHKQQPYRDELQRIIAWIVILIQIGAPHQNFSI